MGRALDLPVYFGDAGSREVRPYLQKIACLPAAPFSYMLFHILSEQVLHKVGAERACAAAITLDTPGANYRTVWALSKYFPNVKTFVRAHDVDHGLNLEKAGATAVSLILLSLFLFCNFLTSWAFIALVIENLQLLKLIPIIGVYFLRVFVFPSKSPLDFYFTSSVKKHTGCSRDLGTKSAVSCCCSCTGKQNHYPSIILNILLLI